MGAPKLQVLNQEQGNPAQRKLPTPNRPTKPEMPTPGSQNVTNDGPPAKPARGGLNPGPKPAMGVPRALPQGPSAPSVIPPPRTSMITPPKAVESVNTKTESAPAPVASSAANAGLFLINHKRLNTNYDFSLNRIK